MSADCLQCGYCCTVGACSYGSWDAEERRCAYMTGENLCGKYEEIKDAPGAEASPAFGVGCSSPVGNERQLMARTLRFQIKLQVGERHE